MAGKIQIAEELAESREWLAVVAGDNGAGPALGTPPDSQESASTISIPGPDFEPGNQANGDTFGWVFELDD